MRLLLITVLLGLVSCNTARVVYDYDDTVDFGKYKIYNYYPALKTGLSSLDERRLLAATDSILQIKGYEKGVNPEFYINFKSKSYEKRNNTNIGIGIGSGPLVIGGNLPVGALDQHLLLNIDFIDVNKDELIWQAEIDDVQNSKNTPENRKAFFDVVMSKVLVKYPPSKK